METNLTPELLNAAASIEKSSTHPLARAIASASSGDADVSDLTETAGEGVSASVGGQTFFIGCPADLQFFIQMNVIEKNAPLLR